MITQGNLGQRTDRGPGQVAAAVAVSRMVAEEFHRTQGQRNLGRTKGGRVEAVQPAGRFRPVHTPAPTGEEGRLMLNSPSTYRLNRSNVKRKPSARRASARKRLMRG